MITKLIEIFNTLTSHEAIKGFILATIIWLTAILIWHLFN